MENLLHFQTPLLVIIDVCTRVVLGYHLVLAREYSRYDVIKTIEKALEPHRTLTFAIDGREYGPHDGFASQRLPELAYVTREWMKLDDAKANLANETMTVLCEFVGCATDAGPMYAPNERPYIERFFGTIASCLSSRLPGSSVEPQGFRSAKCLHEISKVPVAHKCAFAKANAMMTSRPRLRQFHDGDILAFAYRGSWDDADARTRRNQSHHRVETRDLNPYVQAATEGGGLTHEIGVKRRSILLTYPWLAEAFGEAHSTAPA